MCRPTVSMFNLQFSAKVTADFLYGNKFFFRSFNFQKKNLKRYKANHGFVQAYLKEQLERLELILTTFLAPKNASNFKDGQKWSKMVKNGQK